MTALFFSSLGSILSKKLKGHVQKPDLSAYIGAFIAICGLVTLPLDEMIGGMEMGKMRGGSELQFNNVTATLFPSKDKEILMHADSFINNLSCCRFDD